MAAIGDLLSGVERDVHALNSAQAEPNPATATELLLKAFGWIAHMWSCIGLGQSLPAA